MSKFDKGFYIVLTIIGACAIAFAITATVRAGHVAQQKHDFQVTCEFQGGHAATFNEGESYVCIKGGKVIDRD